jgi:rare lipoprotein A
MIRLNIRKQMLATGLGLVMGLSLVSTSVVAKETTSKKVTQVKAVPATNNVGKTSVSRQVIKTSYSPSSATTKIAQSGVASYYGPGFHGRRTANGEAFDMHAMTAAHRTLPFGTKVKVTNLANGKSAIVRVNDRGPYANGRIIDLSVAAAKQIGSTNSGTARVTLEVLN